MESLGREVGISLLVGLIVAIIWAFLGIVTTHSAWSWPDFFGRAAAVSIPVAAWKVIGIAKILIIFMIIIGFAVFVASLMLMAGAIVGF
ncbi:MAG: hypothetical protein ACLQDY_25570 [Streptosporangiaceae bacterium]